MLSANGTYGCAFGQSPFPPTMQSMHAFMTCIGNTTQVVCELPLSHTSAPSGARSVGMGGSGVRGGLMIGMFLLGVMIAQTVL